jgi:hypothetical protein
MVKTPGGYRGKAAVPVEAAFPPVFDMAGAFHGGPVIRFPSAAFRSCRKPGTADFKTALFFVVPFLLLRPAFLETYPHGPPFFAKEPEGKTTGCFGPFPFRLP